MRTGNSGIGRIGGCRHRAGKLATGRAGFFRHRADQFRRLRSLASLKTRAHPSICALARLLAERIANEILQEHARVENAPHEDIPASARSQPAAEGQLILESTTSCKAIDP